MVTVTRLNGKELTVNCDVIECMEETPDTVITFTNGTKIVVKEKVSVIKERIIKYKREIFSCMFENNRE
jgi:flagellar protein FlbD